MTAACIKKIVQAKMDPHVVPKLHETSSMENKKRRIAECPGFFFFFLSEIEWEQGVLSFNVIQSP